MTVKQSVNFIEGFGVLLNNGFLHIRSVMADKRVLRDP
jgi:hypothetical protein